MLTFPHANTLLFLGIPTYYVSFVPCAWHVCDMHMAFVHFRDWV